MRRKGIKSIAVLVSAASLLVGCWDRQEIEQQLSVSALAIDRHGDRLRVTIQVPVPVKIVGSGSGESGGGGQEAVQLFSAAGSNLNDAFKNVQKQLNEELSFGHLRLVIISEELARQGLRDITDALARNAEVRRRLWPLVTVGEAARALKASPKLEQVPTTFFTDMLENQSKRERMVEKTLGHLLADMTDEAKDPIVNYIKASEKSVNWVGTALFKGYRMVDHFGEEDSWVLMHLRDGKRGSKFTSGCPDGKPGQLTIEPKAAKRRLTFDESRFKFHIAVRLDAVINEKTCRGLNLQTEASEAAVEKAFEQLFEERARRVVHRLQRARADALMLGPHVRAFHPDLWDRLDWPDAFSRADIVVSYDVRIKGRGAIYR